MTACRSCGKQILFAVTSNGRNMPVDANLDPNGNVELTAVGDKYHARIIADPKAYKGNRQALHMSHFVTCPFADKHRGKKKK